MSQIIFWPPPSHHKLSLHLPLPSSGEHRLNTSILKNELPGASDHPRVSQMLRKHRRRLVDTSPQNASAQVIEASLGFGTPRVTVLPETGYTWSYSNDQAIYDLLYLTWSHIADLATDVTPSRKNEYRVENAMLRRFPAWKTIIPKNKAREGIISYIFINFFLKSIKKSKS